MPAGPGHHRNALPSARGPGCVFSVALVLGELDRHRRPGGASIDLLAHLQSTKISELANDTCEV